MARRKVIVKRLAAIHDLGAMDVLCTDKTGTLTEARIRLSAAIGPNGAADTHVLELAAINSALGGSSGNPIDEAILAECTGGPGGSTHVADMPFDFERRRTTVLATRGPQRLLIVKGAAEAILPLCTKVAVGAAEAGAALTDEHRQSIERLLNDKADQGERVLAIAWRPMPGAVRRSPRLTSSS